jgi:hypothetical protein
MRTVSLILKSDTQSIEYIVDMDEGTVGTSVIGSDGVTISNQSGMLGVSDAEKQDFALKMYHIILAALKTKLHG